MFSIDDSLKEFVESAVAVLVGTGSGAGRPHVSYGWAPRVGEDRCRLEVFIDTERADETLANLRETGHIAITFADPVSYRSVQLKGRFLDAQPGDDDREWVQRAREAFLAATSIVGDPPDSIRNMFMDDVTRLSMAVEQGFNQTPGPEAGKPL